ncbi:MAG: pantothenate kinase [Ignavibacteriae bacterium]|nr:MAG: pantothenate kinase [Ignavibacteriota bacterium]
MILSIDIGNTQIHSGVFKDGKLLVQFRAISKNSFTSDEVGVFLKNILRENDINSNDIKDIAICSVMPVTLHSIVNGCIKYFGITPFVLKAGVKTGLKIKYRNPLEVGSDRIANAIACTKLFPNKNIVVVDFGTATTFDIVSKEKEYLGGVIIPGIRLSIESLNKNTSQLPVVEIFKPESIVGRSTEESIRSGLYYGQKAIISQLTKKFKQKVFNNEDTLIVATGGFATLFENENLFDIVVPHLVLIGLNEALKMNKNKKGK